MNKIINISEAFSIAAHSMAFIAGQKDRVNGMFIAENLGFSRNHMAKVLKILVKHKFLLSERGPKGGFLINVDPDEVNLLDIYLAIEGSYQDKHVCQHSEDTCPFNECIFGTITDKLSGEFKDYLLKHSIKDLIKK